MYERDEGEIVQEPITYRGSYDSIRYIGDVDGDANVDMIVGMDEILVDWQRVQAGLAIALNPGDGDLQLVPWRPQARLRHSHVSVADLDGDGVLDLSYVHYDRTGSAVNVNLGQRNGELPAPEGVYLLEGAGADVPPGDVVPSGGYFYRGSTGAGQVAVGRMLRLE